MSWVAGDHGYWLAGADGGVFAFDHARFYGSMAGHDLNQPVVGMAATPDHRGYWLVGRDGGVFSFGDARFLGSMVGRPLDQPIVGMAATRDGGGYWLVAADGGVFAFGDAKFNGSCPGIGGCNGAVVAIDPDIGGKGYRIVTSVGSLYAFGGAPYLDICCMPPEFLMTGSSAIVAAGPTPGGVLLTDSNGTVYPSGWAISPGLVHAPVTAIAATSSGQGFWIVAADGSVFISGDANDAGDLYGQPINAPIIAAGGF
jgi:hypothetical protein